MSDSGRGEMIAIFGSLDAKKNESKAPCFSDRHTALHGKLIVIKKVQSGHVSFDAGLGR